MYRYLLSIFNREAYKKQNFSMYGSVIILLITFDLFTLKYIKHIFLEKWRSFVNTYTIWINCYFYILVIGYLVLISFINSDTPYILAQFFPKHLRKTVIILPRHHLFSINLPISAPATLAEAKHPLAAFSRLTELWLFHMGRVGLVRKRKTPRALLFHVWRWCSKDFM